MRRALPWLLVAVVTALAAAIFYAQFHRSVESDLPAHVLIAQSSVRSGSFPGDGLYFLALAVFTGFSTSTGALEAAAIVLLSLAVGAKLWGSLAIARAELAARDVTLPALGVAALALLPFAFSLPTQTEYLGQLPPNVWHNSTTIFLVPFALGLFWCSLQLLRTGEARWLWWSVAAVGLNVVTKPSFVLAFVIVFPLAATRRFGLGSPAWRRCALLVGGAVALLAAQYAYVYFLAPEAGHVAGVDTSVSGVAIAPGRVWRALSASVPLSFLASFAFPLAALAVYRRRLLESGAVRYALALAGAALLLFLMLAETGPRALHGNFGWQVIVANYVLFLTILIQMTRLWPGRTRPRPLDALVGLIYLAHVAAGAWFLHEWWHTGTYR